MIPDSAISIGEHAFSYCTSLKQITLPGSVTSIGDSAFYGCKSLESITLPGSVTSIEDDTFEDCRGLKSITIPHSVTCIGKGAFAGCESLKNITIPNSVTSIGKGAFLCCFALKSITIPDSVTNIGEDAFWSCFDLRVYGKTGSYAERYAKNKGIPFVDLSNPPEPAQNAKLTATTLSKVTVKKNVATVTWKKNTTGKGYQLQYSTDKKFKKSVQTVKISKNKTVKATVKKLKKGTWYFRIRTVSGKNTSAWSKAKSLKIAK